MCIDQATRHVHRIATLIFILATAAAATGQTLPIYCDFDADIPGNPPLTGGDHQPVQVVAPNDGTLTVETSANGIDAQPCVLDILSAGDLAWLRFAFDPVTAGSVRVAATASFSHLVDGFFLQAGTASDFVAARLLMTSSGEIRDYHGTTVGTYAADTPFGVRLDIDMIAKTYSVQIDDEMDGFADDPPTEALPFVNDPSIINDIGSAYASLNVYGGNPSGTALAYDDIVIRTVDPTPLDFETWGGVKRLYR